jgi:sugar/nucleoside kinase (ribokinase family)
MAMEAKKQARPARHSIAQRALRSFLSSLYCGALSGAALENLNMQNEKSIDVVGLGNAIVDVVAETPDALLERLGLAKGTMTLVDEARITELYRAMGPAVEISGGSCANTMAALAGLGSSATYIGKVQDDQLGEVFRHDIKAVGVTFESRPLERGPATARCLVFVTPDAQRTMATYLGACVELGPDDVDEDSVANAKITYLEGYLWDRPEAKQACIKASKIAHGAGAKVALSLSDPFCVDRWRDEFLPLIHDHIDVLIANEAEIVSLYQTKTFDEAVLDVRRHCELAALTRGASGSVIVTPETCHAIDAAPIAEVVDTTGAGDLYAAGLLYGLTHAMALPACGRLGGLLAAEVLGQYGARVEHSLKPLIKAADG